VEEAPKESRADMLARLKAEAVARTVAKEAKQRTLVAIEVKPWSTEQDLNALWKKITTEVVQGVCLQSNLAPHPVGVFSPSNIIHLFFLFYLFQYYHHRWTQMGTGISNTRGCIWH
jgi:hypothetical protein